MATTDLATLLSWVQAYVRKETSPDDDEMARYLVSSPSMSPRAGLDLYRRQHWHKTLRTMQEQLSSVARFFGPEPFGTLSRAYLSRFPPRGESIATLKDAWPEFVSTTPDMEHRAFVSELSGLEITLHELAASAVFPVVTAEGLLSDPSWVFRPLIPVPGSRLLTCQHRVYQFYRSKDVPADPERLAWARPSPNYLMLLRSDQGVNGYTLSQVEHQILHLLTTGSLVASLPNFNDRKWQDWLELWIRRGLFHPGPVAADPDPSAVT